MHFPIWFLIGITVILTSCDPSKQAEVKKQKIGDIELAYYKRGQGAPLVMIMGFRGTMAVWDPALLEQLEKKYTLILFDNRGAGFSSDTEKNETTISKMADDTAALIKALGYSKAHVLGWSMGSRIAIDLAINHGDLVDGLILCSPNPGGKFQAERLGGGFRELSAKENLSQDEGLSLIFPKTTEGQIAAAAFMARLTKAFIEGSIPRDLTVSQETMERQLKALRSWDEDDRIYENLSSIKSPALVAGGLSDSLANPKNVEIVGCRLPFAWSVYFPKAGHDFHSQNYREFAELVSLFLETTTPR